MIKKLQKKLTTLLIFLLTIIWIGILLLFLNSTYQNNLKDVKEDVRLEIVFKATKVDISRPTGTQHIVAHQQLTMIEAIFVQADGDARLQRLAQVRC